MRTHATPPLSMPSMSSPAPKVPASRRKKKQALHLKTHDSIALPIYSSLPLPSSTVIVSKPATTRKGGKVKPAKSKSIALRQKRELKQKSAQQ